MIAVHEKPQSKENANGLRLGVLEVSPELVTETDYISNLLAASAGEGDFLLRFTPRIELDLVTDDGTFGMVAEATQHRHARRRLEDHIDYQTSFRHHKPVAKQFAVEAQAGIGKFTEQRGDRFAAGDSLRPIRFSRSFGHISLRKTGGRLISGLGMWVDRLAYRNGVDRSDTLTILREDRRNRVEVRPSLHAEYAYSPDTKVFARLRYIVKNYSRENDIGNINRDSHGFDLSGGVHFKPTPLIKVSAAAGYLTQYHHAPLRDISGFSAALALKWLPTQLTSINLRYSRELVDGGREDPRNLFLNLGEASVHHELRRNLLLKIATGLERLEFPDSERNQRRLYTEAAATYRPNHSLTLAGKWRWLNQKASGSDNARSFTQMRFSLSLAWSV